MILYDFVFIMTGKITWIEILPRDAIDNIRYHLAKNIYTQDVIPELIQKTEYRLKYVELCDMMDNHYLFTNVQKTVQFGGIRRVIELREDTRQNEIMDNYENYKPYHFDYESLDIAMFYIRHNIEWLISSLSIFSEIYQEIELRIDEISEYVLNKSEYNVSKKLYLKSSLNNLIYAIIYNCGHLESVFKNMMKYIKQMSKIH